MTLDELKAIETPEELEIIARRDLEGKTLKEIGESIVESDFISRVNSKSGVGDIIEQEYFGIKKNSDSGPDIEHLGVEIKTSALKRGKDGILRVKEPLSLNIINYNNAYNQDDIKMSPLYQKNKRILLIFYIHDTNVPRSEYLVKYVFLWTMDDVVIDEISNDYRLILENIKNGTAHEIHQPQHEYLTLCPKHGGTFKDPDCSKSKTKQPCSDHPAEVRAFRLKVKYMNVVIRRHLASTSPELLKEFVEK